MNDLLRTIARALNQEARRMKPGDCRCPGECLGESVGGVNVNRWNIPPSLEAELLDRDTRCIYCGVDFRGTSDERRSRGTWEHIVNDASFVTRENIARRCIGCTASKGTKSLGAWLDSADCHRRGIGETTLASVARAALEVERRSSAPTLRPHSYLTATARVALRVLAPRRFSDCAGPDPASPTE